MQKLRESHETLQRLTSQLQEVQEQMNSMNDSGECQEVESNHSGRLPYVPSQPAGIPSSRSMLRRDKRLPFDTWNTSGLQENASGNQFSSFDSSRNHPQGIHPCTLRRERGSVPQAIGRGTSFARDDEQNRSTIPMPTFARRPSAMSSKKCWSFRRTPWLDSKDSKYWNCKLTNSLLHNHSWFGR